MIEAKKLVKHLTTTGSISAIDMEDVYRFIKSRDKMDFLAPPVDAFNDVPKNVSDAMVTLYLSFASVEKVNAPCTTYSAVIGHVGWRLVVDDYKCNFIEKMEDTKI